MGIFYTLDRCVNRYLNKIELRDVLITFFICFIVCIIVKLTMKEHNIGLKWCILISCSYTFILSAVILGRESENIVSSIDQLFMTYKVILNGKAPWQIYDVLFNIVIFIPIGILLKIKFGTYQTIMIGAISVICIESAQMSLKIGLFEICDIIDNILGIIIGVGLVIIIKKICERK